MKTAFITGAGGYIGSQTALTLAKEGATIAVCDINRTAAENTVQKSRLWAQMQKDMSATYPTHVILNLQWIKPSRISAVLT